MKGKTMKKVIVISTITIFAIILIGATIFSIGKFSVWNPFSSCFGMLQILFTDKEYTIVQKFPHKVILSKPSASLEEYMKNKGFELYDQMGPLLFYSNGTKKEKVDFSTNAYYSKWIWK